MKKTNDSSKKKEEGKVRKPKKHNPNTNVDGIRTRTSQMVLHETIEQLSESQKVVVKEMVLESLLSMTLDGIPSKLGFFVVDNLDTDTMQLRLKKASISISENTVHKMQGVPVGGLDLDSLDTDNSSSGTKSIKLNFLVLFLAYVHSTIWAEMDISELRKDDMSEARDIVVACKHPSVELSIKKMVISEPQAPEPQYDEDQGCEDLAEEDDNAYDDEDLKKCHTPWANNHTTVTPAPSFNIGFSPITGNPYEKRDTKGMEKMPEEDCPPKGNRREVKIEDLMRSPYVKRQVLLGKLVTTEEKKGKRINPKGASSSNVVRRSLYCSSILEHRCVRSILTDRL
ncbi:hypothetical protein L6452_28329 [Arctium lappa]|uniref:Uncharacterized protein n=1 Tax=Arctium lappa TaxID=4217 RepID=A0ACB8ZYY5_ARCLA|nr:hypothetical protein L6452_28329 [Arctium lappa]